MIRKKALSLILAAVMALTVLVSLPAMNSIRAGSTAENHSRVVLADNYPTPTATPIGAQTDSGESGNGNGGG